jgi:osmotically-inducible protein OsmY
MFGRKPIADKDLLKTVNQKLSRTGTSSARILAGVSHGTITLTGTLHAEGQRIPLVKAASRVEGVRQVLDQMTVAVKLKV